MVYLSTVFDQLSTVLSYTTVPSYTTISSYTTVIEPRIRGPLAPVTEARLPA